MKVPDDHGADAFSSNHYRSTILYLTENLTVEKGEMLVLDNSTMYFNCSFDGEVFLRVKSGGTLKILNGSVLTLNKTDPNLSLGGYNYCIVCENGSKIEVIDSKIMYAGYHFNEKAGLSINTEDFNIIGSEICYGQYVHILKGNNSVISRNYIHDQNFNGLWFEGGKTYSNLTINENIFKDVRWSCISANVNRFILIGSRIEDNHFIGAQDGIESVDIEDCSIIGNDFQDLRFGINVNSMKKTTFTNNRFKDCRQGAFARNDIESTPLSGNSYINCTWGLTISTTGRTLIEKNNFIGCGTGISISLGYLGTSDENRSYCRENIVRDCGIGIATYAGMTTFENNTLINCSGQGFYGKQFTIYPADVPVNIYRNNRLVNCSTSIYGADEWSCRIYENEILNCSGIGIGGSFHNSTITGLSLKDMKIGIGVVGYGLILENVTTQDVRTSFQLLLNSSDGKPSHVTGNRINGSVEGIKVLGKSNGGNITGNIISNCNTGVVVSSLGNCLQISKNYFITNKLHAFDEGTNRWDNGSLGNYWSNATGLFDNNADGISETPYIIDEDSKDRYPMTVLPGELLNRPIKLEPVDSLTVFVGRWWNTTFKASDPDGDAPFFELIYDERLYIQFDNNTGELNYLGSGSDLGAYFITVRVYDMNGSFDEDTFLLAVQFYNHPPDVEPIPELATIEGQRRSHQLVFWDQNGDHVTVEVDSTNAPFQVLINSYNVLSFLPHLGDKGDYYCDLNFSDNNGTFTLIRVSLVVDGLNRAPEILPIPNQEVFLGSTFTLHVDAYDDDGDDLYFSVEYSGKGMASITQKGTLSITPAEADVGLREVAVNVTDEYGAWAVESFILKVKVPDRPPTGTNVVLLSVEAGDIVVHEFDVVDPDGGPLDIFDYKDEAPDWVELRDETVSMEMRPHLEDTGEHTFSLAFMDEDENNLVVEVRITVLMGFIAPLKLPEELSISEREIMSFQLGFPYSGNGTTHFSADPHPDFLEFEDGIMILSPSDGDHRTYEFAISSGIKNGAMREDISIKVTVVMNLSTFLCEVDFQPDMNSFDPDAVISASLTWSGYDAPLEFQWVISNSGMVEARYYGTRMEHRLNYAGRWKLDLYVIGAEGAVHSKEFSVYEPEKESGKGGGSPLVPLIVIIATGLLITAALVLAVFYVKRKKVERERRRSEFFQEGSPPVPEGFKPAPPMNAFGPGANSYVEGERYSGHAPPHLRGKEEP
ncbi:MAG: NosD domain-containing protein [Thermoplasmatota archaeon]